jgi:hypothetical protein
MSPIAIHFAGICKPLMCAGIATVKEQAAQIQKVSAQLEVSKRAEQTVVNNQ